MEKNHANFTALHQKLYKNIYYFINLRIRNKQEVEDLVQDVFLKAYSSWKVLPDENSAKNFLYHIAKQRMIDLWKSARKRYESDSELSLEDYEIEDSGPLPEDIFIENEKKTLALKILNSLPDSDREILYLRFIEEKEYIEIAQILNIKEENARQKVSRALQNTKKVVNKI